MAERERHRLTQLVADAAAADTAAHEAAQQIVDQENSNTLLARALLALDRQAIMTSLSQCSQIGNLPFCAEGIELLFLDDGRLVALVDGLDQEDMPTQSVAVLQSGKISVKPLSRSRMLEIHRDNLCSSALRVALEILAVVPISVVEVVMRTDNLDLGSGRMQCEPVLHVRVVAETLAQMNLQRTEAAAVVERLGGVLQWTKRDGFRPIDLAALNIPHQAALETSV